MQPFTVELFVDALILILHCKDLVSRQLVNDLVNAYEKTISANSMLNSEYLTLYSVLIKQVLQTNIELSNQSTAEAFILKFKSNPTIVKDPELYTTLKKIFLDTSTPAEDTIKYFQDEIRSTLMLYRTSNGIRRMFARLNTPCLSNESRLEIIRTINDLCVGVAQDNIQTLSNATDTSDTIARDVDFGDSATIKHAFTVYDTVHNKNKLVTGWQALNRALEGGIELGESLVINTLPYNCKSLFLLKISRWIVTLNKLSADFKNPLCIFYSLENETPQNLKKLFEELWVNDKKSLPPHNIPIDDMVNYVSEKFSVNGWRFMLKRKLGAEFGEAELRMDVNNYIQLGYTPLAVCIDYVNLMKKDENAGRDLAVRKIYNTLCNYLKSINCCFLTAHQLNRSAAEVVAQNPIGAVKKFNSSMLADSTDPQREVDVVFYVHKEKDAHGRSWLTAKLDKHRYHDSTPENVKYFAYMFDGPIGILDDINDVDRSTTNIYAVAVDDDEDDKTTEGVSFD